MRYFAYMICHGQIFHDATLPVWRHWRNIPRLTLRKIPRYDNCLYITIHEIFLDPISNNATKYSAVRYCFYILRYNIPSNVTKYSAARYCLCIVTIRNISYMMNEIFCDTILSSNVTKYSVTLFVYYHERNTSRYDIASNTADEIFHISYMTLQIFRDTILLVMTRNVLQYNIVCISPRAKYSTYSATNEIFLDATLLVTPLWMRYSAV